MTVPSGLPVGATAIADRATGNELKPNADGSLNIVGSFSSTPPASVVSTLNSTTALLTANAVFTGTSESALQYGSISVEVFADQASAANGLVVQQSQDNINWDTKNTFTIAASTPFQQTINLVGQYFQVKYTNGGTNQGTFRLQTIKMPSTASAASSNQRVNAQANDFLTNSIVDLATLLTLSGTPGDANTVNSIMGRLTKIRDLLNGTLTVGGSVAVNTISNYANETGGNLATLAGAIISSVMQSNTKQINGTTVSVNQGNVDAGTQRIAQGGAGTGTKSNVASSATSVTILASNTSRKGAIIYNDSTQILYLDLSGGTASNSSYSVQIPSQGYFEVPGPSVYSGAITGIWAAANGNARVTELS